MTIAEPQPSATLWSPQNRLTTLGMVLLMVIAAFEHLGISTAMPRMLAELDGTDLYAWPFTVFLVASVVATVLSGRSADRYGPGPALVAGPALFLVGLLVAGAADGMAALLAGRVLQGLGMGTQVVAVYVLVAVVYPARARPAVFGLLAAAWVVPSIVGPTAAGLVTEHLGWRWVFLGLTPLALLGVVMLIPAIRGLRRTEQAAPARRGLVLASFAAGFGVTALSWAAQHPSLATLPLGVAGIAVLVPSVRVLFPVGTFRARAGLARTILARGLLAGVFFGVEAFVPLTLTAVHGLSPALAGLPLTVGAVGWSAASMWQGRHPDVPRGTLIKIGFGFLAVGLAGMVLIAPSWGAPWVGGVFWVVAGVGMGLAVPATSVLALHHAEPGEQGFASSALQLASMLFAAVTVGLGGVLLTSVATTANPAAAVVPFNLLMAGIAVAGFALFRRVRD